MRVCVCARLLTYRIVMVSPFSHNYWVHSRKDYDCFVHATNVWYHLIVDNVHFSANPILELPVLHNRIWLQRSKHLLVIFLTERDGNLKKIKIKFLNIFYRLKSSSC